jgi:signal transduction histidine kinase
MDLKKYLLDSYPTVGPFEGVNAVESRLLESNFLVVIDEDKTFHGVLSPLDLIKRPHKIVVDCISKKENITFSDSIFDVIEKFRKNQCSALPVMHNDSFVGIIEKKQMLYDLEQKIKELHDKSLISEKTKAFFLNNLSHEIRTPLNGIIGFLDVIGHVGQATEEEKFEQFSSILKTSTDRFLLIMNDLIELSLICAGDEIVIQKKEVDIDSMFGELQLFFEELLRMQKSEVILSYFRLTEVSVFYADGPKLKHILYHLIDNAIKFTADQQIYFGYDVSKEAGFIDFFVKNKVEIPLEALSLEIFEKQEEIGDNLNGGLGIGLSLVKKTTELMGGQLLVENDHQEVTLIVRLPGTLHSK